MKADSVPTKRSTHNKDVHIVHHIGDANKAEIIYGKKHYHIERKESVFIDDAELNRAEMLTCAPYDNFFVFLLPKNVVGWFAMCACGSPAVIVGYNAYRKDSSPTDTGKMLVCHSHASTGRHADGST